ncbi:MAG: hypothetical protein II955_04895 [Clostridia bacterium]|nr:hypothetical protein [Clostridia bacterium]
MTKKRLTVIGSVILSALSVLTFAVCTPISVWATGDVLVSETIFPTLWDLFQALIFFLIYWNAIAFTVLLALRFGLKGTLPFLGCYSGAALIRYLGSLAVGSLMTVGATEREVFLENLGYSGMDILLDLLQFAIIVLIVYLMLLRESTAKMQKNLLPVQSFFRRLNRLHGTVLAAVSIPSVFRLIGRIRYDVFFGAPQGFADLFWMALYYLDDICSVAVGYLAVVFLLSKLSQFKKENNCETISISGDSI